jgi:hypothetical protein
MNEGRTDIYNSHSITEVHVRMYNFKVGITISFIGYRSNQLLILFFNSNFNVMHIVSCFGALGN